MTIWEAEAKLISLIPPHTYFHLAQERTCAMQTFRLYTPQTNHVTASTWEEAFEKFEAKLGKNNICDLWGAAVAQDVGEIL